MMQLHQLGFILFLTIMLTACTSEQKLDVTVYETSASGNQLEPITEFPEGEEAPAKPQAP